MQHHCLLMPHFESNIYDNYAPLGPFLIHKEVGNSLSCSSISLQIIVDLGQPFSWINCKFRIIVLLSSRSGHSNLSINGWNIGSQLWYLSDTRQKGSINSVALWLYLAQTAIKCEQGILHASHFPHVYIISMRSTLWV